eukprot:CAMPEP_0201881392 /NCGR_PEP_ID=MMETSP0902-20130614/11710_1 /ASSEMBLY_ACC=CAM_ASM_000551 /TAXON_ID=420261 /ORGANISM="Thalassiosira antarctica, Strain CCMP982" /LENGTH=385 /DNA_ID=CAMNT_0048409595 /DNA_START=21 /DNA_END=1178 /DNA_ORIENTATION=-
MAAPRPILLSTNAIHRHCPSALTNILSLYARARHNDNMLPGILSYSRCLHTSRRVSSISKSYSYRGTKLLRHFSDSNKEHDNGDKPSKRHRRVVLKYGRARRKWESKQREEDSLSSVKTESATLKSSEDSDVTKKKSANDDDTLKADNKEDNNTMFGVSMGNPLRERYIQNQRKIKYPRTWTGWKTVWQRAWTKYRWTFEGFILEEGKTKRDAYGNILPQDEESDDDASTKEDDRGLREKATDAADQVAQNVQKNISTMKEEAPKLLQMGQQVTGISSREELREWLSAQLKLGTACLGEFMKGYRKGRDDEVDRMLHQYFKDLDDEKEPKNEEEGNESSDDGVIRDGDAKIVKRQKRVWGRRERRRLKELSGRAVATPVESDTSA